MLFWRWGGRLPSRIALADEEQRLPMELRTAAP